MRPWRIDAREVIHLTAARPLRRHAQGARMADAALCSTGALLSTGACVVEITYPPDGVAPPHRHPYRGAVAVNARAARPWPAPALLADAEAAGLHIAPRHRRRIWTGVDAIVLGTIMIARDEDIVGDPR